MKDEEIYCVYTPNQTREKTFWVEIGRAFKTNNRDGLNVYLTALPINGKLLIKRKDKIKVKQPQQPKEYGLTQEIEEMDI